MTPAEARGLSSLPCTFSVDDTLARLRAALTSHSIKIFCEIDHARNAAGVGLTMRPAIVLIFGNPQAGTALMVEAPSTAIDLPIKALIWEDTVGQVWLSWNTPEYLAERHHISGSLAPLRAAEAIFAEAAGTGQGA